MEPKNVAKCKKCVEGQTRQGTCKTCLGSNLVYISTGPTGNTIVEPAPFGAK